MFRKINVIATCLVYGTLLATAAQADRQNPKELRQNQRFTGATVFLDEFTSDTIWQLKGAPGSASGRLLLKYGGLGPASERCEGFDLETAVVGGSTVEIFHDFSKLLGLIRSGYICGKFDGSFTGHVNGDYVGGVDFEGASGTYSLEFEGVALSSFFTPPGSGSVSGSITGTIVLP